MTFQGANIILTGGSLGIGRQLAKDLSARGAKLLVCARSEEQLNLPKADHPEIETQVCDVRSDADVEALRAKAQALFGEVN